MKIFFDTNIVLDILLDRKPFVDDSLQTLKTIIKNGDKPLIAALSIADIFYICKKATKDKSKALNLIKSLIYVFSVQPVDELCIIDALTSGIIDLEDAIIDACANNANASYLITRNIDDFKKSKNHILTPSEFLKMNER